MTDGQWKEYYSENYPQIRNKHTLLILIIMFLIASVVVVILTSIMSNYTVPQIIPSFTEDPTRGVKVPQNSDVTFIQ